LDTCLQYMVATGRTGTWTITANLTLTAPVGWTHHNAAGSTPAYDTGPANFTNGITPPAYGGSSSPLWPANSGGQVTLQIGPFAINAQIIAAPLSPAPPATPTSGGQIGTRIAIADMTSFTTVAVGSVNNNATVLSTLTGPNFGSPTPAGYLWAQIVQSQITLTITLSVTEYFSRHNRHSASYTWVASSIAVSDGSSTLTYTPPAPGRNVDSYVKVQPEVITENDMSGYSYSPDYLAQIDSWSLSGTQAGNDFTSLGGSLPITTNNGGMVDTQIDARKVAVRLNFSGTDTYVPTGLTSPRDKFYGCYGPFNIGGGSLGPAGAYAFAEVWLCPAVATRAVVNETWWDGSPFVRKGTDAEGNTLAANLSRINDNLSKAGTIVDSGSSNLQLGSSGFRSSVDPGVNSPTQAGLYLVGSSAVADSSAGQMYVYSPGDPWFTNLALGRLLGQLTLSDGGQTLSGFPLSVTSTSTQTTGNTSVLTADLGNWACRRYLQLAVSGITLATGHHATLKITLASGTNATYTLRPSGGVATIDLTCPDSFTSSTFFGDGVGLFAPAPQFVAASNSAGYARPTNDGQTAAANAHVASLTLAVPGASEAFQIDSATFVGGTGVELWVDPVAPGDPAGSGTLFDGAVGCFNLLVDGKRGIRYPFYGKATGIGGVNWLPLTAADWLYDIQVLANGYTASLSILFTPPGGAPAFDATILPIGTVQDPNWPFGSETYHPWSGTSKTFDMISELQFLDTPVYCCQYDLSCRWVHGGGLEGIAYNAASNLPWQSSPVRITPAGFASAANPPTSPQTVTTDSGGFWRVIYYDRLQSPTINKLVWPQPSGSPAIPAYTYASSGTAAGDIKERAYNHFACTLSPIMPRPANLCRADGWYHRASNSPDTFGNPAGIYICNSEVPIPVQTTLFISGPIVTAWGEFQAADQPFCPVVTANIADSNPALAADYRGRLYCQFDRWTSGGTGRLRTADTYETYSDDDGETWRSPHMTIPGGQYPDIAAGHDGSLMRVAYVDDGTGSGTGTLWAQYQAAGDPSPSAAFQLKKADGVTPIAAQMGAFKINHAWDGAAQWILTVLEVGKTLPTEWVSTDELGGTFTLLPT
jgi:hypothetical protein